MARALETPGGARQSERRDMDQSILWLRLDRPGHEFARVRSHGADWHLSGTAVFVHEQQPCRLDYLVVCDRGWQTRSGRIIGWIGNVEVEIEVAVDSARRWRLNGKLTLAVEGCIDLDLNFSPSTNLLPIRRLNLAMGQEAPVRAAWLRFPGFTLEPLDQRYRRTTRTTYRYESAGGSFVADLEVDRDGLVTRYPGFCEVDAPLR
jgi:hypothetical protein